MRAVTYLAGLAVAAAGVFAALSPLGATPTALSSFCPDYGSPPRCGAAVGLFLAGKPGDDAIIASVNAIIDRAHRHRTSGKSCDDLEAGLDALAAATADPGSRSLIASVAASLCTGTAAGGTISPTGFATGTIGFAPVNGSSGDTSGNTSGGTSGDNTSGGTSGGNTSGGTSGDNTSGGTSGGNTSGNTSGGNP